MKKITLTALIATALTAPLTMPAQAADHMHMDHSSHGQAALADGVVKKVDKTGGKLTVSHGPLPNGMPAMTMAFKVKDAAWLDKLKEGDKIRFATETINGVMTITQLQAAQ